MLSSIVWKKRRSPIAVSSDPEKGLKVLAQISNDEPPNVLFSSGSGSGSKLITKPRFYLNQIPSSDSCFLKRCFLCNKKLGLDKEVYMYKGEEGFCSVECRNRKIYMDEMEEIEASTNKVLESFRQRNSGGRCETSSLLEEFRQLPRHPISSQKNRVSFSLA